MTRIRKAAIAWSAVCVIWLIFVLIYAASRPSYEEVDKGRIMGQVIVAWISGLVVIAFIWFVTRGGPARSADLSSSGAVAPPAPVASTPPEGWYDDAERPGHTRWWNGTAWGMRDDEHPSTASTDPDTDVEIVVAPAETAVAVAAAEIVAPAQTAVPSAAIAIAPAESPPENGREPAATATAVEPNAEAPPAAASSSTPEPASAPQARFCENCGAERRPGGRFCTSCGHA